MKLSIESYLFLFQIILLGSILTLAKLLNLSSNSLFSRVSPALYLLRCLTSFLGPSVLDTVSSSWNGMMRILLELHLLSSLASASLNSEQFFVWILEQEPLKLVQEALSGRFEASPGGERRRMLYLMVVQDLTVIKYEMK